MKTGASLRFATAIVLALSISGCGSTPVRPTFSAQAFEAAKAEGKPILIDVAAGWCPTCQAQAPTIAAIEKDPAFAKLVVLKIDFDSQTAAWRQLGVNQQSTLIAYHGSAERGRSVGVTDPEAIRQLATSALN